MPPRSITMPAKMKTGSASSTKRLVPSTMFCGRATSDTVPPTNRNCSVPRISANAIGRPSTVVSSTDATASEMLTVAETCGPSAKRRPTTHRTSTATPAPPSRAERGEACRSRSTAYTASTAIEPAIGTASHVALMPRIGVVSSQRIRSSCVACQPVTAAIASTSQSTAA